MDSMPKALLIVGCQRSGTTLLASMLGRHSDVSMLFESTTSEVFKQIGKQYNGNKLSAYRQIRMRQRASRFGHLVNRLVNLHFRGKKYQKVRVFPTSELSIEDYIDMGAIVITVVRYREEVVSSIVARTEMNRDQALAEYKAAMQIIDGLKGRSYRIDFYSLIHNTEQTLMELCDHLNLPFEKRMLQGSQYNSIYPNSELNKEKAQRPFDDQWR